jgi:hypothetical protein
MKGGIVFKELGDDQAAQLHQLFFQMLSLLLIGGDSFTIVSCTAVSAQGVLCYVVRGWFGLTAPTLFFHVQGVQFSLQQLLLTLQLCEMLAFGVHFRIHFRFALELGHYQAGAPAQGSLGAKHVGEDVIAHVQQILSTGDAQQGVQYLRVAALVHLSVAPQEVFNVSRLIWHPLAI